MTQRYPNNNAKSAPPSAAEQRGSPFGLTKVLALTIVLIFTSLLAAAFWLSNDYETRKIQRALQAQTDIEAAAIKTRLREAEAAFELIAIDSSSDRNDFNLEAAAQELLKRQPAIIRIELRQLDERGNSQQIHPPIERSIPTSALQAVLSNRQLSESRLAMQASLSAARSQYSRPYYVPLPPDKGVEVIDLAVPIIASPQSHPNDQRKVLVGVYSTPEILKQYTSDIFQRNNQVLLQETDGTFIARLIGGPVALNVYSAKSTIDLQGISIVLRSNSPLAAPTLTSNVVNGILFFLSLALAVCGYLLWRDSHRRAAAEQALAAQYSFRAAMENSLVTGLRARDLEGRVTYVNPAFCDMVGYPAVELIGQKPPMAYWAPEGREDYESRYAQMLAGTVSREAYETIFMRSTGERLNVMIFEAPLIDGKGHQSGWMSSILDISNQRKIEETNRLQQETIAANSRLAMLGEVATALSHELNQPLAAITSYATAAENIIVNQNNQYNSSLGEKPITVALERIRGQAERAGRVIKSVHDFVRYRSIETQAVNLYDLLNRLEPIIKLQTGKTGIGFIWQAPRNCEISSDAILLEQVVLNLTRNASQAMSAEFDDSSYPIPYKKKIVEITVSLTQQDPITESNQTVRIEVLDRGVGVPDQAREHLFNAFKSNTATGMGIGLSFCRSVVEQLGGSIHYQPRQGGGSIFSIELPTSTVYAV